MSDKLKRGDVVRVKMNRGPDQTGNFVKAHTDNQASGEWLEIKRVGSKETFRCRRSCVSKI